MVREYGMVWYGMIWSADGYRVEERLAAEHELVDDLRARAAVGVVGHVERSVRVHQVPDARRNVVLELHLIAAVPRYHPYMANRQTPIFANRDFKSSC